MSNVHSPAYQIFLKKLRKARIEAGLTQESVAQSMKRPQSFVAKMESGERRLDLIEVQKLARLYKKPLSYFAE